MQNYPTCPQKPNQRVSLNIVLIPLSLCSWELLPMNILPLMLVFLCPSLNTYFPNLLIPLLLYPPHQIIENGTSILLMLSVSQSFFSLFVNDIAPSICTIDRSLMTVNYKGSISLSTLNFPDPYPIHDRLWTLKPFLEGGKRNHLEARVFE